MPINLGRYVFAIAALTDGLATLVWHAVFGHSGPLYFDGLPGLLCVGAIALLFDRSLRVGSILVGAVYAIEILIGLPSLAAHPLIFATWGNLFYPLTPLVGAVILIEHSPRSVRIASILMGVCALSYGIEQVEFLARSASLVPKWIPPSQMFWAIATCIPFGLAAIALIGNIVALLATRLYALMMLLFAFVVWIPILVADQHTLMFWSEATLTFTIGAAIWVLADRIATNRSEERALPR